MLTNEEYVKKNGYACPNCGDCDLRGDSIEIDSAKAYQDMCCGKCQSTWTDVYNLVGYENLKV